MSEISETEIKSMTKEQNYMRGYKDGKSDVLDNIRSEIQAKYESIPGIPWRFKEYDDGWVMALEWVLDIIDKYKTESEDEYGRYRVGN